MSKAFAAPTHLRSPAPSRGRGAPKEDRGEGLGNAAALAGMAPMVEPRSGGLDIFGMGVMGANDPGKYIFAEDGGTTGPTTAPPQRKSQVDALPALREKHASSPWEDQKDGVAFAQGQSGTAKDAHAVDPNDVAQGALGDCYLMAGMAGVARANPEAIQKLIKDNGDGTFEVTLHIRPNAYSRPQPIKKTIDARLARKAAGGNPVYAQQGDKVDGKTEMWPALLEKTLAQHKGSYDLISGGNVAKGFQFHGASELFTGKAEGYHPIDRMKEDDALLTIAEAIESRKPVTADTRDFSADAEMTAKANAVNVYGNHAYAPSDVDLDARTVTLQNPWGSHHVEKLPIAEFMKYYRSIRVGGK
jgi:hypothetical protein